MPVVGSQQPNLAMVQRPAAREPPRTYSASTRVGWLGAGGDSQFTNAYANTLKDVWLNATSPWVTPGVKFREFLKFLVVQGYTRSAVEEVIAGDRRSEGCIRNSATKGATDAGGHWNRLLRALAALGLVEAYHFSPSCDLCNRRSSAHHLAGLRGSGQHRAVRPNKRGGTGMGPSDTTVVGRLYRGASCEPRMGCLGLPLRGETSALNADEGG
jgi:hypothetical protein